MLPVGTPIFVCDDGYIEEQEVEYVEIWPKNGSLVAGYITRQSVRVSPLAQHQVFGETPEQLCAELLRRYYGDSK